MKPARLGIVLFLCVFSICLPRTSNGQTCSPPFIRVLGWLEKYFLGFPSDKNFRVVSECPPITTHTLNTLAQQACTPWRQAAGFPTQLNFTYTEVGAYAGSLASGIVICPTFNDYQARGGTFNTLATTVTTVDPANGNILRNIILIDGDTYDFDPQYTTGSSNFSLLGVLVHEWGHALGLGHSSSSCRFQSVMAAGGGILGSNWQERIYIPDQRSISALYAGFPVSADLSFAATGGAASDTLFWAETTSRYCTYNLSVSDACWGPYVPIGRVIGVTASNRYSFINPARYNRDYFYRLTVEKDGAIVDSAFAWSHRTEGDSATFVGTPAGLTVDGVQAGGVALSWQPAAGTVEGYYVYRGALSLDGCGRQNRTFGPMTGTAFVDSSADPGVPLAYRVRAFNGTASSPISDQAVTTVLATISKADTAVVACPQGDAGRIVFAAQLYPTDGVPLGDPTLRVIAKRDRAQGAVVRVWEERADTLYGTYTSTTHQAVFAASQVSLCGHVAYDVYANGHLMARGVDFAVRSYDLGDSCLGFVDAFDSVRTHSAVGSGSSCTDLDKDGDTDSADEDRLTVHLGHHCPQTMTCDLAPPSVVYDLAPDAIESHEIFLSWTNPGDDGQVGQADYYELRGSMAGPITSIQDWNAADVYAGSSPGGSGSTEGAVAAGLSAHTYYYFAVRVRDESGNWSGISNSPRVRTLVDSEFQLTAGAVMLAASAAAANSSRLLNARSTTSNAGTASTASLRYSMNWSCAGDTAVLQISAAAESREAIEQAALQRVISDSTGQDSIAISSASTLLGISMRGKPCTLELGRGWAPVGLERTASLADGSHHCFTINSIVRAGLAGTSFVDSLDWAQCPAVCVSGDTLRILYVRNCTDGGTDQPVWLLSRGQALTTAGFSSRTSNEPTEKPTRFGLAVLGNGSGSPFAHLRLSLPVAESVRLEVFDILGRRVRTLELQPEAEGTHDVYWDGQNDEGVPVSNGMYFASLRAGASWSTARVLFVRNR